MSKTYSEKLKDPRWQRKRLEVLDRDNFTCQHCLDKKSTLHVHHKYYLSGLEPWEYHERSLITLCEGCHEIEEGTKGEYERLLITTIYDAGFSADDLREIASGFHKLRIIKKPGMIAEGIADIVSAADFLIQYSIDLNNKKYRCATE